VTIQALCHYSQGPLVSSPLGLSYPGAPFSSTRGPCKVVLGGGRALLGSLLSNLSGHLASSYRAPVSNLLGYLASSYNLLGHLASSYRASVSNLLGSLASSY
jgi:hypothetical protein